MGLFEKLKEKAVNNRQRIVLPESTEPRTLAAADRIIADGVAEVILIGSPDDILAAAKQQELKDYFAVSAMGIEGLFMEWIVRALKPGGKAFIVVPDGIMNRSNDKKL